MSYACYRNVTAMQIKEEGAYEAYQPSTSVISGCRGTNQTSEGIQVPKRWEINLFSWPALEPWGTGGRGGGSAQGHFQRTPLGQQEGGQNRALAVSAL